MRRVIACCLALGLVLGNMPALLATASSGVAVPKSRLTKSRPAPATRSVLESTLAAIRTLAEDVARRLKDVRHPRVATFGASFVRLQALSEVPLLATHSERAARFAKLGVTVSKVGNDLVVTTPAGRRVVKDMGARPSLPAAFGFETPDGGSPRVMSDEEDEWDAAQAYGEDAIADIEAMSADAESAADDLEAIEPTLQAMCAAPDGGSSSKGPCYDAVKTSVMEIFAAIAGYAENTFNIRAAIQAARAEVEQLLSNWREELISWSSVLSGLRIAATALIAEVNMPWYAAAAAVAVVGFAIYEAYECLSVYMAPTDLSLVRRTSPEFGNIRMVRSADRDQLWRQHGWRPNIA